MDYAKFADDWRDAWNAHDVERVLEHFHDDVVFTSPVAARLRPGTDGLICGKPALRSYWTAALELIPALNFTIEKIFVGVDVVVIQYRNQKGVRVSEVLEFDGERVRRGHGTYAQGGQDPAGLDGDAVRTVGGGTDAT